MKFEICRLMGFDGLWCLDFTSNIYGIGQSQSINLYRLWAWRWVSFEGSPVKAFFLSAQQKLPIMLLAPAGTIIFVRQAACLGPIALISGMSGDFGGCSANFLLGWMRYRWLQTGDHQLLLSLWALNHFGNPKSVGPLPTNDCFAAHVIFVCFALPSQIPSDHISRDDDFSWRWWQVFSLLFWGFSIIFW